VLLHNWAPGKAAQFGLDLPRIWHGSSLGWSTVTRPAGAPPSVMIHPWHRFMVQAHSGLADLMRGANPDPRRH